jgi:hypothetical protein
MENTDKKKDTDKQAKVAKINEMRKLRELARENAFELQQLTNYGRRELSQPYRYWDKEQRKRFAVETLAKASAKLPRALEELGSKLKELEDLGGDLEHGVNIVREAIWIEKRALEKFLEFAELAYSIVDE